MTDAPPELTPEAIEALGSLGEYRETDALAASTRLRATGLSPETVAAVLTQARLRAKGRAKFGDAAARMLFTPAGLEQATRPLVADMHARRYVDAGATHVADATCGIGADAAGFARAGLRVTAFDLDPHTAAIARHNLRDHAGVEVRCADGLTGAPLTDADAAFADPARRNERGRRHRLEDYSPPMPDVLALRGRFPALGVKVAPAIEHDQIPADAEAEWVSVDGTVVEAGLWCGPLARTTGHAATVVRAGTVHTLTGSTDRADAGELGDHLVEPDGAVIRAGLIGELADRTGAHLIDPSIAYLTSSGPVDSPFATSFRILDELPFAPKALAKELRARGIGRLEIKKRGVDVTPEELRPRLRLSGEGAATIVLTRIGHTRVTLLVERVTG